ncbi:MAG TPA: hypothetical protein VJ747_13105 [Stellaceae bacterium]|nr:hypothetical protein [Stellaceae bacterium]
MGERRARGKQSTNQHHFRGSGERAGPGAARAGAGGGSRKAAPDKGKCASAARRSGRMYHVKPTSVHHLRTIVAAPCTISCTSARTILQHRRRKKVHRPRIAGSRRPCFPSRTVRENYVESTQLFG